MTTECIKNFCYSGFLKRFSFHKKTMFYCEENLTYNTNSILDAKYVGNFGRGVLPIVELFFMSGLSNLNIPWLYNLLSRVFMVIIVFNSPDIYSISVCVNCKSFWLLESELSNTMQCHIEKIVRAWLSHTKPNPSFVIWNTWDVFSSVNINSLQELIGPVSLYIPVLKSEVLTDRTHMGWQWWAVWWIEGTWCMNCMNS